MCPRILESIKSKLSRQNYGDSTKKKKKLWLLWVGRVRMTRHR